MKQLFLLALMSLFCLNIVRTLSIGNSNCFKGIMPPNHVYYTQNSGSAKNHLQTPLVTAPEVPPYGIKTANRAVIISGINKENYEDAYLLIAAVSHPLSTSITAKQIVAAAEVSNSNRLTNTQRYLYINQ